VSEVAQPRISKKIASAKKTSREGLCQRTIIFPPPKPMRRPILKADDITTPLDEDSKIPDKWNYYCKILEEREIMFPIQCEREEFMKNTICKVKNPKTQEVRYFFKNPVAIVFEGKKHNQLFIHTGKVCRLKRTYSKY
jgi:hypothetical protein